MYEVIAISKDNHKYRVILNCNIKDIPSVFKDFIIDKGWDHYEYKIHSINEITDD